MDIIPIFLAIAIFIIAMAFLLTFLNRRSIRRDRQIQRAHERHDDGLSAGVGTGIGIDELDDH